MRMRVVWMSMLIAAAAAGCQRSEQNPRAETQPGAALDQNRGAQAGAAPANCRNLPSADDLKKFLKQAPGEGGEAGGLFSGKMMWASVVNRNGEICSTAVSTDEPASTWPGSQAIAKAKAYTANAYSTDALALSTARLYTLTQPGHSLWGVAEPNPFNPDCVVSPQDSGKTDGKICGGSIAFGGGLALYRDKTRVGGLGVSGDTACTDHEISKRVRHLAGLDPEKGPYADDIIFSSVDGPSPFAHPLCANTWRNGKKLGDEQNSNGY
jgi:uncharacterized protein GlcG (DUF336 family)